MQLGRLGVWYAPDKMSSPDQISAFVKTVEGLGYETLWYPESRGFESFTVAGFMLAHTSKLKLCLNLSLFCGFGVSTSTNAECRTRRSKKVIQCTFQCFDKRSFIMKEDRSLVRANVYVVTI